MNSAGVEDISRQKGLFVLGSFSYLLALAIIASKFEAPLFSLVLAPLPLLLLRFTSSHIVILVFACNLYFFPPEIDSTNFYFLQIADGCLLLFLFCYFFNRENFFSFTIPVSGLLVSLYLFLAFIMIRSIEPFMKKGYEIWLFYDLKKYMTLALVAFFCTQPIFRPKKIIAILLPLIFFAVLHATFCIIFFFFSQERQVTWNEIYFGNLLIVCLVLINALQKKKYQIFLAVAALILTIGILAAQTRSIWMSTAVCIMAYMIYLFIIKMKQMEVKQILKMIFIFAFMLLIIEIVMRVFLSVDLGTFLFNRLSNLQSGDMMNPFATLGYRIYESYNVWLQKTFWGHGTGAYLYLFQTQSSTYKFIYWWSIHCEYMEILHKWGIFGLILYLVFVAYFLKQSFQLLLSKKKFISAIGAIAFFTFVNTLVISLTSGYMMRVNMIMYDILMIGMVVYYHGRERRIAAIRRRIRRISASKRRMSMSGTEALAP